MDGDTTVDPSARVFQQPENYPNQEFFEHVIRKKSNRSLI